MSLFSRSARSLIQRQRGEQWHIKVLQTLGCAAMQDAIDIKVLQTLGMARETRSDAHVASEGPSPTGNGNDFLVVTVARGPVPRDLSTETKTPAAQRPRMVAAQTGAWRGTGPRPTVAGQRFALPCRRDLPVSMQYSLSGQGCPAYPNIRRRDLPVSMQYSRSQCIPKRNGLVSLLVY